MLQKPSESSPLSFVVRYGAALLLVGLALAVTLFTWLFIKSFASPLFLFAIAVAAWRYGMRPGIFATIVSGIAINYFFVSPEYQNSGNWDDALRLLIFAVEGYALCWLIESRTKASEEMRSSREQLQALSLHQQTLREEERKRIALEIHDQLGQSLTGLKMDLHFLSKNIGAGDSKTEPVEVQKKIGELADSVDSTILAVRRIATELRPPILDDLGLVAAIEWQTTEFQKRTGITCVLSANVDSIDVDTDFTTAVFRIFQETLTNIIRHAEANTITVNLKKLEDKLVLRVEDDGRGIRRGDLLSNGSLGILGMRERARLIGGELKVSNGDTNGTIVLLTASLV